jgi:hypothetical protein
MSRARGILAVRHRRRPAPKRPDIGYQLVVVGPPAWSAAPRACAWDDRHPELGGHAGQIRIKAQGGDIVDHGGTRVERRLATAAWWRRR